MSTHQVNIDVISETPDGSWVLILVEEGPWPDDDLIPSLRRIQERLYGCIDVAIDGHLASLHPESKGKPVIVRLDCYDTPDAPIRDFVDQFASHVRNAADIQGDLKAKGFIASLRFEYNWDTLGK